MWENETVVLVTSLKKRILGDKGEVRFGNISADNSVPTFIKTFFQNRVEDFIEKESPLSIQATPHFKLQPNDIENLKSRFQDVFRERAFFHQKEVEDILNEALVLRLDYLIKPMDTMKRLLFEKKDTVDLSEMEEILRPFTKVLTYADQVLKECHRQEKTSVKKEEYTEIMDDLFRRAMEMNPVKVVLQDLSVLKEFLSETKGEEVNRVEGVLILDFLKDRNLWGFQRAVEVEMKLGKEDFDSVDLEMTLNRYIELKNELSEKTSQKEELSMQLEEEKFLSGESDWDFEEILKDDTFSMDLEEKEKETRMEKKKPYVEKPKPKPMKIIRKEEEGQEAKKVSEKSNIQLQKGIRSLVDDKTEKVFIKKLFNGDATAYQHLMDKLDEAESWRVAKILIDNELFKRDVDPFSREAIKMVDLVYNRFYPEEGVGGKK